MIKIKNKIIKSILILNKNKRSNKNSNNYLQVTKLEKLFSWIIKRDYLKRLNYLNKIEKIHYKDIDWNMRWKRREDNRVKIL